MAQIMINADFTPIPHAPTTFLNYRVNMDLNVIDLMDQSTNYVAV